MNPLGGIPVTKIMYWIYNNVLDVTVGPLMVMDPLLPININLCGDKLKGGVM